MRTVRASPLADAKKLPGRIGVHADTKRSRNQWIILLDENMPDSEVDGTIAHEIAHAWLSHDLLADDGSIEVEVAAASLARDWGFSGTGADPDYRRSLD